MSGRTGDFDLAVMGSYDLGCYCKSQTGSANLLGMTLIHAVKTFRQPRNVFLRNADAVVANLR